MVPADWRRWSTTTGEPGLASNPSGEQRMVLVPQLCHLELEHRNLRHPQVPFCVDRLDSRPWFTRDFGRWSITEQTGSLG